MPHIPGKLDKIEARFERVLLEVLKMGNVDRLTVISHSQGSVIAVDVLWYDWTHRVLKEEARHLPQVSLVTMGSPLSHLYQHYFPERYPPFFTNGKFNSEKWGRLNETLKHWLNIYRVDDYVGTHVDWDGAETKNDPATGAIFENRVIAPGGHMGYWMQEEVMEIIRQRQLLPG
jgi:hypothetical protein